MIFSIVILLAFVAQPGHFKMPSTKLTSKKRRKKKSKRPVSVGTAMLQPLPQPQITTLHKAPLPELSAAASKVANVRAILRSFPGQFTSCLTPKVVYKSILSCCRRTVGALFTSCADHLQQTAGGRPVRLPIRRSGRERKPSQQLIKAVQYQLSDYIEDCRQYVTGGGIKRKRVGDSTAPDLDAISSTTSSDAMHAERAIRTTPIEMLAGSHALPTLIQGKKSTFAQIWQPPSIDNVAIVSD